MRGVVLDTNAIIHILGDRIEGTPPEGPYFVSVLGEIEALGYPSITPSEERELRLFLSQVEVLGISPSIRDVAIHLRRKERLRLPDAVVAATALDMGLPLVTNDSDFAGVGGLQRIRLALRS